MVLGPGLSSKSVLWDEGLKVFGMKAWMNGFWDEGFNIFGMKGSHILAGRRFLKGFPDFGNVRIAQGHY